MAPWDWSQPPAQDLTPGHLYQHTGTCRVFPKTSENSQIFVFLAVQTSNLAIETTVHVYKLPGSVGTLKYAEYGR